MSLAVWARWLAWLAAETTALVVVAGMLQLWFRSPQAGRTIWRAALTTVALVWVAELSGLRGRMPGPVLHQHHFVITATALEPSLASAPSQEWQRRPADDPGNSGGTPLPLWVWLGGSMLLLGRFCLARVWLAQRRRGAAPADEDSLGLMARWQSSFGLSHIHAQVWPGLRGPVAFGILRPTIVLPAGFVARFSSAEREAMLAHEMAHLAAHDPFWGAASDAIVALAWWHPLVWWSRSQLQCAHEAAADEASALIPGGAHTLAECLVRLGRELTAPGPARALGIGGNGPRSQLAARVERLLGEPRAWQPLSVWARWMPQVSAIFVALASALIPIQTGLTGSIFAVLATAAPVHAEVPTSPPSLIPITPPLALPANNPPPKPIQVVSALTRVVPTQTLSAPPPSKVHVAPTTAVAPPTKKAEARPEVSLLVQFVELTENEAEDLGLDWVFGQEPMNNPAVEISHDWMFGLEPIQTNHTGSASQKSPVSHPKNLVIDHFRTDGQSTILQPKQFAALLKRIETRSKADILATPKCITLSGLRAQMTCYEAMACVTDVQATSGVDGKSPNINYTEENIGTGIAVDIQPNLDESGKWRLQVRASTSSFLGYDDDGHNKASISAVGGKPIGYEIPHPHFRAVEADAENALLLGQSLAMRGPSWTETTKTKGHFLVPAKTKTIRQRLYIFVTPSLPSPSELKKS